MPRLLLPSIALAATLAGSGGAFLYATRSSDAPTAASVGRAIFFDPSLSASGHMSCASCHDPAHAHAQANDAAVQPGGADLDIPGFRAVPSLRYLNYLVPFHFDEEGTPIGGVTRDGRTPNAIEQASRPLLGAHEMANTAETLTYRISHTPYAADFKRVFGERIFDDPQQVVYRLQFALAAYQLSASELHPFDSKYDLFLKGKVKLSTNELRGLALFNRSDKGNCAACHPSARDANGTPPLFTDYSYDNLGVPRNAEIAANADPNYYDLGLCGPFRTDLAERRDLCGAFKVPTLRNVATRRVFFHNGRFKNLRDTVRFYVRRDTNPEEFYPSVDGQLEKFDDLPAELRGNVNHSEVPYDRQAGELPRLSEDEIDDLLSFLSTLTDGYDPVTNTADPARSLNAQH